MVTFFPRKYKIKWWQDGRVMHDVLVAQCDVELGMILRRNRELSSTGSLLEFYPIEGGVSC